MAFLVASIVKVGPQALTISILMDIITEYNTLMSPLRDISPSLDTSHRPISMSVLGMRTLLNEAHPLSLEL